MKTERKKKKTCQYLFLSPVFPFCFLFLWLHHEACGILVPWSGIEPEPLQWKHGVLLDHQGSPTKITVAHSDKVFRFSIIAKKEKIFFINLRKCFLYWNLRSICRLLSGCWRCDDYGYRWNIYAPAHLKFMCYKSNPQFDDSRWGL